MTRAHAVWLHFPHHEARGERALTAPTTLCTHSSGFFNHTNVPDKDPLLKARLHVPDRA